MDEPQPPIDPMHGLDPMQFVERILAFAPAAALILLIIGIGAYGAFWLYRKGRQDEREGFRGYIDMILEIIRKGN